MAETCGSPRNVPIATLSPPCCVCQYPQPADRRMARRISRAAGAQGRVGAVGRSHSHARLVLTRGGDAAMLTVEVFELLRFEPMPTGVLVDHTPPARHTRRAWGIIQAVAMPPPFPSPTPRLSRHSFEAVGVDGARGTRFHPRFQPPPDPEQKAPKTHLVYRRHEMSVWTALAQSIVGRRDVQ